jgi:hypothetical protein
MSSEAPLSEEGRRKAMFSTKYFFLRKRKTQDTTNISFVYETWHTN